MAAEPTGAMPGALLQIHPLTSHHLSTTAALHAQQLANGLFPALGQDFLRQWHRTFLDTEHAAAAVVLDPTCDDAVIGYLLLALNPAGHLQDLKTRHRRTLMHHGLRGLIRRPDVCTYFLRTRSRRYARHLLTHRAPTPPPATAPATCVAVVHAVVTHPDHTGRGVARQLLAWAQARAADAGVEELALVTDAPAAPDSSNVLAPDASQGAAAMYDHLGWRRVAQRHRDGRTLIEFRTTATAIGATHE
ncbi:GNAT family N-acetyltransferase [Janibacter melonis]|uniref:GNAT family N-acetyltransferase n=1 Tax=Janibacter melonis TaxID=262209 RepID=UPI002096107C|nr:GNAT family N-acetyltransferase [Janibacter melonis]